MASFPQLKRLPLYPAEQQEPPAAICVTGASSYVAGSIIPRLLAAGHTVHGTVRNPGDTRKVAHLEAMAAAAGDRLKLFKADLTEPGSFDAAVAGCKYVIHVASPVLARVPKGKGRELLIEPAIKGVENVLRAVQKTESVQAVVLTSSCGAVFGDYYEHGKGHVMTEEDWAQTPTESWLPYNRSKVEAERRAWALHDAQPRLPDGSRRWRLVSVLPGFVVGPPASIEIPAEVVTFYKDLLSGRFWPLCPPAGFPFVDVDDVAAAHVLALVTPSASGRYILSAESANLLDYLSHLRPLFPGLKLPMGPVPKWVLWLICHLTSLYPWDMMSVSYGKVPLLDHSKAEKELGLHFNCPKQALIEGLQAVHEMMKAGGNASQGAESS